jgi:hypothetical protein
MKGISSYPRLITPSPITLRGKQYKPARSGHDLRRCKGKIVCSLEPKSSADGRARRPYSLSKDISKTLDPKTDNALSASSGKKELALFFPCTPSGSAAHLRLPTVFNSSVRGVGLVLQLPTAT